ncbi:MAG: hypothetical protein AAFZ18_32445 [Myxococcota bacterium]
MWRIVAGVILALSAACGDGVGAECSKSGVTDGCGSDFVCTGNSVLESTEGMDTICRVRSVCLRVCASQADCGEGEVCRTVFEGTQMSCQVGPGFAPPDECTVVQQFE